MKKQTVGLKRDKTSSNLEKYYTKKETVDTCIKQFNLVMKDYSFSKENDVIIEPSAGNGAFIEGCKKLSNNCLFFHYVQVQYHKIKNYLIIVYFMILNLNIMIL